MNLREQIRFILDDDDNILNAPGLTANRILAAVRDAMLSDETVAEVTVQMAAVVADGWMGEVAKTLVAVGMGEVDHGAS